MEKPPTPEEAEQQRNLHRQNTRMANQDSQFGVDWQTGQNETVPRPADEARAALAGIKKPAIVPEPTNEETTDLTPHEELGGGVHLTPKQLRERANRHKADQVRQLRQDIAIEPDQEAS